MGEGAIAGSRRSGRIWRRVTLAWVVLAAGCLVGTSCGGSVAVGTKALRLKACTIDGLPARCGTAMVPEDRLTGTGPRIPVRVVVFPASSPRRVADPIICARTPQRSHLRGSANVRLFQPGAACGPASWPACAIWPSPSCAWPVLPPLPRPCAITPGGRVLLVAACEGRWLLGAGCPIGWPTISWQSRRWCGCGLRPQPPARAPR